MGPECGQMRCDPGLVVSSPASVEPPVAFGRLERGRLPLRGITFRLHVVVGVQQHRRRSGRGGVPGDHRRSPSLGDDAHVTETRLRQQLRHCIGAAMHLRAAGRVGPHGLDAHQVLEVGPHRRQHVADTLGEITHGVHASCSRSPRPRAHARGLRRAAVQTRALAVQGGQRSSSTATAAAVSASWVSDRWIVTSLRCSAIAPDSRTRGRPHMSVMTSMSR